MAAAMDAARARFSQVITLRKEQDAALQTMKEWAPGLSQSHIYSYNFT